MVGPVKEYFVLEHTVLVLKFLQEQLDPYIPNDVGEYEKLPLVTSVLPSADVDAVERVDEMLSECISKAVGDLEAHTDLLDKSTSRVKGKKLKSKRVKAKKPKSKK